MDVLKALDVLCIFLDVFGRFLDVMEQRWKNNVQRRKQRNGSHLSWNNPRQADVKLIYAPLALQTPSFYRARDFLRAGRRRAATGTVPQRLASQPKIEIF